MLSSLLIIGIWMLLVLSAAVICRKQWPDQQELSRKIVHIGTGPIVVLAWWLSIPASIAVPVALTVTVITAVNRRLQLLPAVEDIDRNSYGTVAYGLAISLLLILFWPDQAVAVCAGVLVMAFADGLAGLIGRGMTSPSWTVWQQRKSVAGTLTMGLVTALVLLPLVLISESPLHPLRLIAVCALAVGLEQLGRWGIDNLSVPMAVGLSWTWMTV
ncbi:phytol kinase [Synechococcus sp. BIOS-E4-1]|uniref:diacylglycerol/polyprenol kinase family protein n=1 Tax=Synechococcus sp. BIOS-E4-1 TaxID=1400864 RepID=UPI001861338E|nr:dolichol kinase [Synechococcus sp. BIOS-E4-1]QNI56891.1 phytol kinase [Synechococcus sp. BIOS-E4-1]